MASVLAVLNLILSGCVSKLYVNDSKKALLPTVLNLILTGCVSKPVVFYKLFITSTYLAKML